MELLRLSCIVGLISVNLSTYTEVLDTTDGFVQGILIRSPVGRTVRAYLGIPYCQPPIGNLRFNRPLPLRNRWPNVFLADKYSKSCIQGVDPKSRTPERNEWWIPADNDTSEDCLTLNVWAPMNVKDAAVMVWIHGGGFEGGTSSSDKYDGQILAALGDIIVVSMNHRLNILGYLYMGHEYRDEVPGNVGMMDQAQALRWVRDNIKQFGGDPNKVTLFGESSGGASVNHHMTIPWETKLFNRAIIQSGTSNNNWGYTNNKTAAALSKKMLEATGCSDIYTEPIDLLSCLRTLDVRQLVERSFQVPALTPNRVKWAPTVEGLLVPADPETILKSGKVDKDIDAMLGTTTKEGSVYALGLKALELREDSYLDQKTFQQVIKDFLGTNDTFVAGLVQHFYTNWEHPSDPVLLREQFIHFITDYVFHCKTNPMSDLLEANGNRVYRYQYSHRPSDSPFPKWAGATHGDELNFVFGWPNDVTRNYRREECYLSSKMIYYWSNFAKYGNPNGPRIVNEWPRYLEKDRKYLDLGLPITVKSGENLRYNECSLWNNLWSQLMGESFANK